MSVEEFLDMLWINGGREAEISLQLRDLLDADKWYWELAGKLEDAAPAFFEDAGEPDKVIAELGRIAKEHEKLCEALEKSVYGEDMPPIKAVEQLSRKLDKINKQIELGILRYDL